jgi:hypothetical protein
MVLVFCQLVLPLHSSSDMNKQLAALAAGEQELQDWLGERRLFDLLPVFKEVLFLFVCAADFLSSSTSRRRTTLS